MTGRDRAALFAFAVRVWMDAGLHRLAFVPQMKCSVRAQHALPLQLCHAATSLPACRRGWSGGVSEHLLTVRLGWGPALAGGSTAVLVSSAVKWVT